MTPDRSIGNGIMEGMNCLTEISSALDEESGTAANHSWLDSLHAMDQAFAAVQAGEVVTSIIIGDELVERVRRVREMVSNWMNVGHPPNGLKGEVDAILASFGLPLVGDECATP